MLFDLLVFFFCEFIFIKWCDGCGVKWFMFMYLCVVNLINFNVMFL